MKKYFLSDPLHPKGGITINVKNDDNCVFCKHCSDIYWDYTHLIYMILCELENDHPKMTCRNFEESEE